MKHEQHTPDCDVETLSSSDLIARLEAALAESTGDPPLLAFDGDGTLWSGDVGNDVFVYAINRGLLGESLRPKLLTEATTHRLHVDLELDTNSLAQSFVRECQYGRYPERDLCALQTWCYAGMTEVEVQHLSHEALGSHFGVRHQAEVTTLVEWGRATRLRCVVVSASPLPIVETAAKTLGFVASDIVAARAVTDPDGTIETSLLGEVPYGPFKVELSVQRFGHGPWLAAFGDNSFDAAMLDRATIGVAVRPKPALQTVLPQLTNVVKLARE